jgi:hypothetical protein
MVYDKLENGSNEAEENLLEAIDLDPDLLEANYYLGFYYEKKSLEDITHGQDSRRQFKVVTRINPNFVDGWIQWARVTETFFWPPHSEPSEILAEGLKLNPQSKKLYITFKRSVFWHSQEEQSIPTFQFMIKEFPEDPEYPTDLTEVQYNLENYSECKRLLDQIESNYSDYSKSKINLLRAKIAFQTDTTEIGLDHYWKATEAIKDSLDVRSFYVDIQYIMKDIEYEAYSSTPIKDMNSFFNRFWLARDPNLATPENERIPIHFKRLNYSRKHFRRYLTSQKENQLLYKFEHPLNGIVPIQQGDVLTRSLLTQALQSNLDIDDRGLIYIRHGDPDRWADYTCMLCAQNLSWQYFSRQNQPEMIFHFRKHAEARGWFLESLPYAFSNRGDFGGVYALLDPTFEQTVDLADRQLRYEQLNRQNIKLVDLGLNTESVEYDYEKSLVEFPLKLISFKSSDTQTDVDLYYWISGSIFQLNTSESGNQLVYSKFISFFDENWNRVVNHSQQKKVPLLLSPEVWEESGFVDSENVSVPPGKYYCEIQFENKVSNNLGVYKGTVIIPDYSKEYLMLSDVILSGPVSRKEGFSYFKRGDIAYEPHMFSAFHKQETFGIYMEVYNLLLDTSDRTSFEVTWYLRSAESDDEGRDLVQSSIQYSGNSKDDKIYFNVELTDIEMGDYEMVVKVKDMISDFETRKIVKLSVR